MTKIKPRRRHSPHSAENQTPVESEAAPPAPSAAAEIGKLSTGGDSDPQARQEAAELILTTEKRVRNSSRAHGQQEQIRKVRFFLKQAQQALSTGDAAGAKTLATKAKLLLDDLHL